MESDFKKEWFENPTWWFHATPKDDSYLASKFEDLIDHIECQDDISKVIIYDQLSRHYYRHFKLIQFPILHYYLEKAIDITSSSIVERNSNDSDNELCFLLLPFRHSKRRELIMKALSIIYTHPHCHANNSTFKNFLIATYERMPLHTFEFNQMVVHGASPTNMNNKLLQLRHVLDKTSIQTFDQTYFYDAHHVCVQQIERIHVNIHVDTQVHSHYIVSLSGGVDSMVCAYIMKQLNIPFTAVHINYNNRGQESNDELEFLQCWCQQMQIPFVYRTIDEIHRETCMSLELRDLYEEYTRRVRFHTYLEAWRRIHSETNTNTPHPYIILGHNKDDQFENILTNIAHQHSYDNLTGMQLISTVPVSYGSLCSKCTLLRPLLNVSKKQIYEFALIAKLPFFKDSTPKWSQRGIIRDIIRPTLQKWNPSIVPAFFTLSNTLRDSMDFLSNHVNAILDSLEIRENTKIWHYTSIKHIQQVPMFWSTLFHCMTPSKCPSKRSIQSFMGRLEKNIEKNTSQLYTLHSYLCVKHLLNDHKMVFIIYPYSPST